MLEVQTGCRIHFGLMELCAGQPLCFGGLGLMLESPGFRLRLEGRSTGIAPILAAPNQDLDDAVRERIQRVIARHLNRLPQSVVPTTLSLIQNMPLHSGLGAGTQLACGTTLALQLFHQVCSSSSARADSVPADWKPADWKRILPAPSNQEPAEWLAEQSGRGLRSAVGLSGILHGGLILDRGRSPSAHDEQSVRANETSADAAGQIRPVQTAFQAIPPHWRILLIRPRNHPLISGEKESELLGEIGKRPNPFRTRMCTLAEQVQEFARDSNFTEFVDGLEQYMTLAGAMFADHQSGPYNGPHVTQAVSTGRECGLRAVGQSSWGPTVFGFCETPEQAQHCQARLLDKLADGTHVELANPACSGAKFRWRAPDSFD